MNSEFYRFGFKKFIYAKDRISLADCFTSNNRCGIYILHFSNNDYYVGQAKDVVRRHIQHRKNHDDIEYISFKEVKFEKLNQVEKDALYLLEKTGKPLRNISLVSLPKGESDLDLIIPKGEIKKWMNYKLGIESLQTPRFNYPALREKYNAKYKLLATSSCYEEVSEILQDYVQYTIPYPCKTEYSFWACSCLPVSKGGKVFARVNIFWQETLNIRDDTYVMTENGINEEYKALTVSIFLCKSKLLKNISRKELKKKYPTIEFTNLIYPTGGQDQLNILIEGEEFLDFLYDTPISDAIKEFNLRLMRKGGCNNNRYHCFDLADDALRTDNIEFE